MRGGTEEGGSGWEGGDKRREGVRGGRELEEGGREEGGVHNNRNYS